MGVELSSTAETVLLQIKNSSMGTDAHGMFMTRDLLENQFGEKRMPKVEEAIQELINADLIDLVEDEDDVWKMTPYGLTYITQKQQQSPTVFSNIQNSNIAHASPGARQTIDINSLDQDLQEKVAELDQAVKSKDKNKIKEAFNYIADKSVDVAIALATGNLIR